MEKEEKEQSKQKKPNRWQRKKPKAKKPIEEESDSEEICESNSSDRDAIDFGSDNGGVSLDSLLFYSPKITQTIDDKEVFEYVQLAYPDFESDHTEKEFRKLFLNFLEETVLVENILEKYNYNMMDLISLFCRQMPYLFTTRTYVSKVREIIKENYADSIV